ncbi:cell division cycle-associated 7-like protein [Phtheirospermum japonicum]|uniref:Cell division cycle-associated 7-like protein n=1 Tax=Phtheirospermum japonicum TaxID=374723 RepID=A0A830B6P9_9LAMI|nr:cell division cycle-associated 7-like protein [Phtheirospermum japonicum]
MMTPRNTPTESINSHGKQQQHQTTAKEDFFAPKISDYELSREERIKENRERLQKLGIFDLSIKLNALSRPNPKRSYQKKTPLFQSPLPPSGPVRRSSRLQNSTPVSYCEVQVAKKEKSLNDDDFRREVGSKPEVYTDEHEKLLGSIEKSWTLFVDGYGIDGKRIYDPVRGKTCHQCRYGENVLEANENPNWVCPVCRGICNCSLCRQAKGWPPTGTLYRKISSLGYKSVAHYLIQTRRSDSDLKKNVCSPVPGSAKRSLPFSDIEITKGDDDHSKFSGELLSDTDHHPRTQPEPEKNKEGANSVTEMETTITDHPLLTDSNESSKCLISESLESGDGDKEKSPKSNKRKHVRYYVSTPDSIGGRLRQRHNRINNGSDVGSVNEKGDARNGENSEKRRADVDTIASRLKMRRRA